MKVIFHTTLFIGFPLNDEFSYYLDSLNSPLRSLFIREGDSLYLSEILHENQRYLGKYIGELLDAGDLSSLEINIYSLLKKIVPEYQCEKDPLVLIAVDLPTQK